MESQRPIVVVGSGYVGLVAALCFAEIGHSVLCVDHDPEKIEALRRGRVTVYERHVPELLARLGGARVHFTTDMAWAIPQAELVFVAVGTPQARGGKADLSYVEAAVRQIAAHMRGYTVVVEKSTVPVFTSRWMRELIESCGIPPGQFDVVSNPEFLREGSAIADFLHPDRIVVGAAGERAMDRVAAAYAPLTSGDYYRHSGAIGGQCSAEKPPPLMRTSCESAELIKYASNAFLAMKVSFVNAVANLCEKAGADIAEVVPGVGADKRIGTEFFHPGIGYGGSCFPKDLAAFRTVAEECGVDFSLLGAIERINEVQPLRFLEKVREMAGGIEGRRFGVLGLAYKGGTDDVRESPGLRVVRLLLAEGGRVAAYDPAAMEKAASQLRPSAMLEYAANAMQAAAGADLLLILTDWPQFLSLDLAAAARVMAHPRMLDGRNLFDPEQVAASGMDYACVGRRNTRAASVVRTMQAAVQNGTGPGPAAWIRKARPQRILLTGAAGFLGSHLADRLLGEGHHVIGVDNLSTGSLANIAHLSGERRFDLIERDACEFLDPGRVDFIFNFASPASPPQYMRRGIETLRVGSEGTLRMLELAAKYSAGFLHASTSECYGTPEVHPQPEWYWGNVNPVGPRSVYDEAKRFSEAAVMAYRQHRGVATHLVRIFNTYGPRMQPDDGRVVSNFIMQALRGEPVTVYGDGSHTRSFCYVDDLIEGIIRLARTAEPMPVNLGNPAEETVLNCARRILELTDSTSEIRFEPLPKDDPPRRRPDITKARELLQWEPQVSFEEGLRQTIAYFRSLLAERVTV
jgi:UDPglucose 6-dehydrogenase